MAFPVTTTYRSFVVFKGGGIRIEPQAEDPAHIADGHIWYNSTDDVLNARIDGETVSLLPTGGSWNLIENRLASGATEDFIDLAAYDEVMIMPVAVTNASNSIIQVRVSTDNGQNYLSASGTYKAIAFDDPAGVNKTEMPMHATTTTLGKHGLFTITAMSQTSPKFAWAQQYVGAGAAAQGTWIIPGTTPINAIRLMNSGGDFNGGNFYIFGR